MFPSAKIRDGSDVEAFRAVHVRGVIVAMVCKGV